MGGGEFPSTDFAITTINVPDRLDLRDLSDGGPPTVAPERRSLVSMVLGVWLPRVVVAAIVVVFCLLVWFAVRFWMQSLSAESISQTLTTTLRVPVSVESSHFSLLPSPRLQFDQIVIDKSIRIDQGAIRISPALLARAWQKGGQRWADLNLVGVRLSLDQAEELLQLTPSLGRSLANSIGSVHLQGIEIADHPWFTGRWSALTEFDGTGFRDIYVRQQLDKAMIQGRLKVTAADLTEFDLQGSHWRLPAFPSLDPEFVTARGSFTFSRLKLDEFSLGGGFGELHGSYEVHDDGKLWRAEGTAESDSLDSEGLIQQVVAAHRSTTAPSTETAGDIRAILQGASSLRAKVSGFGGTFLQATQASALVGQLEVRAATLNGINLGYLATHPDMNVEGDGGSTRFPRVTAIVTVDAAHCEVEQLFAKAGALSASGSFSVGSGLALSGQLHVDLGATRILAPIRLRVGGTLDHPRFGK